MSPDGALELARRGELYPSVILHGGEAEARREVALQLSRTLLCAATPEERPCGVCSHCRRVHLSTGAEEPFHPDFAVLERDLKTSISVDATKAFLKAAQVSPFEARGQAFVIASAESLTGEAANALLKTLEEPGKGAPRHFLLLAPSQQDLLPTLRSRSLAVYLGGGAVASHEEVAELAERFGRTMAAWAESRAPIWLLAGAAVLEAAGDFADPRDERPWALAARAVVDSTTSVPALRRPLLGLAEELLAARRLRLRGITARRILDGLVARHLSA